MIFLGRVFGFPIHLEPFALLFIGLFVARDAMNGGAEGALMALSRFMLLFLMVFVHEMGHALVARRYDRSDINIVLTALGGFTTTRALPSAGWGVLMSLAGPMAGFALGVLALGGYFLLGAENRASIFLEFLVFICFFWNAFNLLPMYPLDGGKVLMHGLRKWTTFPKAERFAAQVGVVTAVVVGVLGLVAGEIFIALIAGFALMQSVPRAMAR